jgi:hypothetical protein
MKNIFFGLIATVLFAGIATGQTFYSTISEVTGNKTRGGHETLNGISCPPNSLYAHNINYQNAFSSYTGGPFIVFDQLVSTPADLVGEITFYGVFDATPGRNFTISFYSDNGGFPDAPIASYTTYIAGNNTGLLLLGGYPIYSYNFVFPASVNLVAGDWVSVFADGSDNWYWCSGSGGDGCVLQTMYGFRCDFGDAAFCLGASGGGITEVPVSNWALLIGGILIAGAIFLRYRRIL